MIVLLITKIIIVVATVTPVYTANILGVFPHHGFSHHAVFLPYFQELANRGHNITIISNYPSEHPNITDISILGSMPILNNKFDIKKFVQPFNEIHRSINTVWSFYIRGEQNKGMLTVDGVTRLLSSTTKFDLLIAEHFNNELSMVFALKFNVPFLLTSTCNLLPWNEHVIGQPRELAVKPLTLSNFAPKMNFYDRVVNMILSAVQLSGYLFLCRTRDEKIIKQTFNMDVSLAQHISNASLIFVNTHFSIFGSRSLVPAVVEVGGIHVIPNKQLSTDIQKFIDEAEHGVIYFCLGSLMRAETLPIEKKQMFLNVFKKIPQRILWKWEGDLTEKPSNVMIREWMPQRDILAHPNVKLFISHGGLLGTIEAIYESVPILFIPIGGDQFTNSEAVVEKGAAEMLNLRDINEEEVYTKIELMLTNPKYKQKTKELSETFRDRPMSPMETAVYWTEYVIRHKGAPHLRSTAVGMPWYQYYLIDVIFVIIVSVLFIGMLLNFLIFKVILKSKINNTKVKQT